MEKYGEILFLGPCNLHCYFCLSNEMPKLNQDNNDQMHIHFKEWPNFVKYLYFLREEGIKKIYLSSVTTEPMLYEYIGKLIAYLKSYGFTVGIRTNGYLAIPKMDELLLCDEEISFSINSLNPATNKKICGISGIPDYRGIFKTFIENNKKCRISIVINKYNAHEIKDILNYISVYSCVNYMQIRQVYKYGKKDKEEIVAFQRTEKWLKENAKLVGNYYESPIYEYNGLRVSLWKDVFKRESIHSYNYFTNGLISEDSLLIPAYEERRGEIHV